MAALLGKRYGTKSKHKTPLELTEIEANEVKLEILELRKPTAKRNVFTHTGSLRHV